MSNFLSVSSQWKKNVLHLFSEEQQFTNHECSCLDSDHVSPSEADSIFIRHAHLSTCFGPNQPGDGTEIVVVRADEDPEHGGLSATPLHVLGGLGVGLHLYWCLTPRVRFYETKVKQWSRNSNGRKEREREGSISKLFPHGNHESGLPLAQPAKMKANGVTLLLLTM